MNMQPETTREVTVIGKILADLVRTVQLIESDIAAEEERAKISDRSDAKLSDAGEVVDRAARQYQDDHCRP